MRNNKSEKPKFVSFDEVDEFVEAQQAAGRHWFWDGWTLEVFTPMPRARTHRRGAYRAGQWGFISRINPTAKGDWVFNKALLK